MIAKLYIFFIFSKPINAETSINNDKTISFTFEFNIISKPLVGKKPPEEIIKLKFAVFCLGTNPTATQKTDQGDIDIPIVCGDVIVNPDDIIVADDDGVVVIPKTLVEEVYKKLISVADKEKIIIQRIKDGETTCEIFNIQP